MAPYRVTLEFQQPGGPPTQAASEHLLERLRAAAPEADVALELGIGRLHAGLTILAQGPDEAVDRAVAASREVFARPATRIDVASAEA
ncbi:hypothetical protein OJ997_33720 [Solirubrobacter phytolaccae]|uniref:Uncharacterized protein n=1 Tax=Solirubrobacter phytolaccae TaxID=1404360 RepID=A0A9X3SC17_9ACTN|nr:hypothetical protein [Solirubrobacter phytolaccae]MDA0185313.1 hypothetical protein [Solirubrobacter phytolaccae]